MLKAAVAGGADAVYLGLDRFNARRKADNFTEDNFGEVISYCHLRGVKVYVAFNTLVKDNEFSDAKNYVDFIVNSNADGIILQDMGILHYVHSVYPDFPIHVSTQAGISTVEGARFMKNLGASRVVLARETSLEVVKQIHQCVDIEIEYFVQGALCVCYSGNCYMSSIIDGNSGNRGLCAQVCRTKLSLVSNHKEIAGYNISTYDTMLLDYVKELFDSGVISFKIEGRLRSPEYVYSACLAYKKALIGENASNNIINDLKTTYNRGDYSTAYLFGRRSKVIYNKIQGNIGRKIGFVDKVIGRTVYVNSSYKPAINDGFKVLRNGVEVGGGRYLATDKITNNGFTLNIPNLAKNDEIRLNYSDKLNCFANKLDKKVEIKVNYTIKSNGVLLTTKIGDKEIIKFIAKEIAVANKIPLSCQTFEEQFRKCGNTDFEIVLIKGEIYGDLFLTFGEINAIRREFLTYVKDCLLVKKEYQKREFISNLLKFNVKKAVIVNEEVFSNLEIKDDEICVLRPSDYNKISGKFNDIYLYVPNFLDSKDMAILRKVIKECNFAGVYADGNNAVGFAIAENLPYIVGINCNITNKHALCLYKNAVGFVNSKELNKNEVLDGGMVLSEGNFINMTFVHCPLINSKVCDCSSCKFKQVFYKDSQNRQFKLYRNKISGCLFSLTNNVDIYINGVDNYLHDYSFMDLEQIKKLPFGNFNKGHFNRGIK